MKALPKIELHRHLEGSMRLETLYAIALENAITLPSLNLDTLRTYVQMTPDEPRSPQQFLSKFGVLRQFFRSKAVIQRVTREVIADAAADNIRYMELRFTPKALNNIVNVDYTDVIRWVCQASGEAGEVHNINVALIISLNRHESLELADEVLAATIICRGEGSPIIGIDLAGREADFPAALFSNLFLRARDAELGLTIHAGEWAGVDSVRGALELSPDRIGHGVRVIEDEALVEAVIERGTVLEICPSSNIDSGVYPDLAAHPLAQLYERGVKTTINTDDPLVSDITLSDEFTRLVTQTSLTLDDIKRHQITAAKAAFLPDNERETLVRQFESWMFPAVTRPLRSLEDG
jgi:adenosine deaminase